MKHTPTVIPPTLRKEMDADPFYKVCALAIIPGHTCEGRITREHAIIYGGEKVQKRWAIIPLCARAHEVDQFQDAHTMKKELHVWVALNRASIHDLKDMCGEQMFTTIGPFQKTYPWLQKALALEARFGPYSEEDAITRYVPPKVEPHATVGTSAVFSMVFTKEQEKMIKACISFYADELDMLFTKPQMVDKMIRAAYEALPKKSTLKVNKQIA